MNAVKKIFVGILIGLLSICLIADGMYLVIKYCLPGKVVFNTFNINELAVEDDSGNISLLGNIMEVNYFANQDSAGVELFELKLNTLTDEESTNTYSSGIQIVGDDEDISYGLTYDDSSPFVVKGDFVEEKKGFLNLGGSNYWYKSKFNCNEYFYNTDGTNISYTASLPINEDKYFLITIGTEKFRMSLKTFSNIEFQKGHDILWSHYSYYHYVDWNYISGILFNSVRSLPAGYDGTLKLKFGDLFDYWAYDEDSGQYSKKTDTTLNGDLIETVINSYYTIKVNTYYTGATVASDSLFGMIEEKFNYNKTGSSDISNYFLGRQIINLDENDFDYVLVDGKFENNPGYANHPDVYFFKYNAKLKDNVKEYLSNKTKYVLKITIHNDNLYENGIIFNSFIYDDFFTSNLVYEVVYD